MNPRDLPEVVAELIIEMHEVRSELNAINGRLDRLDRRMESVDSRLESVENEIRLSREEARQNTDRLIDAFGRSMEPLINRILDHETRLGQLEKPQ